MPGTPQNGALAGLRVLDLSRVHLKVGGLKAYGLDYPSLKASNPRLIYCSVTGFGQDGPYAARPGYDFLVQGMGGLMSLTGRPDGSPGEGPLKGGVALTDVSRAEPDT
jgi:crotonobetainyl-CoA:carnitine CoA-transferase CaiB-like acyl-CoA transferase